MGFIDYKPETETVRLSEGSFSSGDTSIFNKNATYNIIKNISAIIFPLVTFPYISRVLGPENLGKINFSVSIVSYFSLIATLGISTYALRECAAVRNDKRKLSEVSSQIYSINILSTIVAYAVLIVTLIISETLYPYRYLIAVQSLTILFSTLGTDWINTVMSDFKYITLRTLFFQILSLLLMFAFVRERGDYVNYAYISILAASGANIINIAYRKRYCRICFTKRMKFWQHIKSIIMIFSIIISQTIFVSTDTTLLGIYHGDGEVGLYGVSTKIYGIVNTLIISIATVVLPELSELFAKRDYKEIVPILKYALNVIVVFGIPCIVGINVLADEIIYTLSGSEYAGAVPSLRILTLSLIFSFLAGFIVNTILLPSKKDKIILVGSILGAVVNFVLNLIFIPIYGLNAAALTTALGNAVLFFAGIPFVDKQIKLQRIAYMFKAPVIGTACMTIIILPIKMMDCNVYIKTIGAIAAGSCVYVVMLLLLKDGFAMNYLRQISSKLKSVRK